MSEHGLRASVGKMTRAGVGDAAVSSFVRQYRKLESGATGLIPETAIRPLLDVPRLDSTAAPTAAQARQAMSHLVIIKLNGGLGTSMGMQGPKSLLPVRDGRSFLDLIVAQVFAARKHFDVELPLLMMNSFSTDEQTVKALGGYPDLPVRGLPTSFVQSREPRLRVDTLEPVSWPQDPTLEWCPPGHGDIYTTLTDSGLLETLIEAGIWYAFVANCDNIGAVPDAGLASWFASSGTPYAAEVCRRTPNDIKGGHLGIRVSDGRLILRDTAQTPPADMPAFTDLVRHPFFHANNLWWDLRALQEQMRDGPLDLPLIRNVKTVDPADRASPPVVQIETAMGAAIEAFDGAMAIEVPRERFTPVKTTNELLLVRSDVFEVTPDARLRSQVTSLPAVRLGERYQRVADFEQRIPEAPSLREATSLAVDGDWWFGRGVRVSGDVRLADDGCCHQVPDGAVLKGASP